MSHLLKTRIEKLYPGKLQAGSYFIEKWTLPGGKTRERQTPAEEIINISSLDNKIGSSHNSMNNVSCATTSLRLCLDYIRHSGSCILLPN
jgi:hypothetical protein